jgi:hypothetical protein
VKQSTHMEWIWIMGEGKVTRKAAAVRLRQAVKDIEP